MTRLIRRLLKDRQGATAIEYGLIGGLISIAILGGLSAFADQGTGVMDRAMTAISAALTGSEAGD